MTPKRKLLIIDSSALIHRAYHAIPFLKNKKGEKVNAVYGFCSIILRFLKELQPSFVVAAFDLPAPTFRHQQFDGYKAKRPKTPADLSSQMPKTKEALMSFGISFFEKKGFEADDIIGTISQRARRANPNLEIVLLSGDRDLLQLVDQNILVYLLGRGVKNTFSYDLKRVRERYEGLEPKQLIDYKSLKGDASDNIPGVRGIGEKMALYLIKHFGSLNNLYSALEKDSPKISKRIKELLREYKEDAFLSRELVRIKKDIPIDFKLDMLRWDSFGKEKLNNTLKELGFKGLAARGEALIVSEGEEKQQEVQGQENLRLF